MKTLHRSRRTKVLGGVAAGFAEYFGIDVTLVRLLFALLAVMVPTAILAYILAWIIMPEQPLEGVPSTRETATTKAGDTRMDEKARDTASLPPTAEELLSDKPAGAGPQPVGQQAMPAVAPKKADVPHDRSRQFLGYILIVVGAVILARRFIPSFIWRLPSTLIGQFWPVLIILAGVALIFGAVRGR